MRTSHHLPGLPASGDEMLLELASHPWSWLVHLFGAPRSAGPAVGFPGGVGLPVLCGATPVTVRCVHRDGWAGISHRVGITGEKGSLDVAGRFDLGRPWRFEAPVLRVAGAAPQPLGEAEDGLPDPWYRANGRAIAAVVSVLRGEPAHPALVQWAAALRMDEAAHTGFGLGPP